MTRTLDDIPGWVADSNEWSSAWWLLTDPVLDDRAGDVIDFDARIIHLDRLDERPWSRGQRLIIDAAVSLYTGRAGCSLGELVWGVERDALRRVLVAIQLRAGFVSLRGAVALFEREPGVPV